MNGMNPNSVVGNYYMGGGMYNQGYVPPQPIGNVLNVSGQGYMGGYYNPYGQNFYSPYAIHQQQEQMKAQMREERRKQSDIWKKISRNVNSVLGTVDDIEEHIKKYDYVEENSENYQEMCKYNKLANLQSVDNNVYNQQRIQLINNEIERVRKEYPNDMSLIEFFAKAGELLVEAKLQEQKKAQRDISKLYNKSQYNELIKLHSGNANYFNSVFSNDKYNNNISIDDLEVKLPSNISNEYYEKKRAFLESIFK